MAQRQEGIEQRAAQHRGPGNARASAAPFQEHAESDAGEQEQRRGERHDVARLGVAQRAEEDQDHRSPQP